MIWWIVFNGFMTSDASLFSVQVMAPDEATAMRVARPIFLTMYDIGSGWPHDAERWVERLTAVRASA